VGYGGVFVAGKEGRSLTQLDAVFRDGLFGEVSVFLCCRRLEVLVLALEKVAVCTTCHDELLEACQAMRIWFSCDERRLKEKEWGGDIIPVIIVPVVLVSGMSDEADV
jgi:hypothetical protein